MLWGWECNCSIKEELGGIKIQEESLVVTFEAELHSFVASSFARSGHCGRNQNIFNVI